MEKSAPDHRLGTLAAYLRDHQREILQRSAVAIRQSPEIPNSDRLTQSQLLDHLPQLLDELCDALAVNLDRDQVSAASEQTARVHGQLRWQAGYHFDELVQEIAIVRAVIMKEFLSEYFHHAGSLDGELKHRAKSIVHNFFDTLIYNSIKQFTAESESATSEYQRRLEEANVRQHQLMRTVSHEMGNFLNAIVGASAIIADRRSDEDTRARMYAMLKRNTTDMRLLLDQLLDYSVLLAGHDHLRTEVFDLHAHFQEIVSCFQPLAEAKGLQFHAEIDDSLTVVVCDRLMNKQIVSNLLSNAIKYTHQGEIRLQVNRLDAEHYLIRVADTGEGIAAEHLPHIFEEFYRSTNHKHIRGTGLGLAITKRLVERLRGEIRVESQPGRGTTFEVRMPKIHGLDAE